MRGGAQTVVETIGRSALDRILPRGRLQRDALLERFSALLGDFGGTLEGIRFDLGRRTRRYWNLVIRQLSPPSRADLGTIKRRLRDLERRIEALEKSVKAAGRTTAA
jgi:hypothetical protein